MSTDHIMILRQDEIQQELAQQGLRMEYSLSALDDVGHAIVSIATGEMVDDEDLTPEIIALAGEWSTLEIRATNIEVFDDEAPRTDRELPPVPDRVTFNVWHDGDSSVGLPGDRSKVEIDLSSYAQEDRRDYLEQVRESLKSSFGALWDMRTKVMTADEVQADTVVQDADFSEQKSVTTQRTAERELAFTVGTGDGWNCHTPDGLGFSLNPMGGGESWRWMATRAWWDGVGVGEADSRAEAVSAASKCLTDAGLSLDELPARTYPTAPAASSPEEGNSKTWSHGDTAKFGKNNERDVPVFAGLFRYSGLGMGNYYGGDQRVEWIETTEAQRRAREEGVRFVYWDAEQAFDPAGYEATTGDKYVSMPASQFQWWRGQQEAWSKLATALQDHWSSRVLDRGVDGAVEVIKMLAKEAKDYRALGRPQPQAVAQTLSEASTDFAQLGSKTQDRHGKGEPLPEPASDQFEPVSGFVLAFPGAPEAEAEELLETLRMGGNTVFRVPDDTAATVLREVTASAGLDADDFQP